jgi:hypothetical protein
MDYLLIAMVWALIIGGPWIKYPNLGEPYSLDTLLLCVAIAFAFLAPSLFLGMRVPGAPRRCPDLKDGILLLFGLCSFVSVGLFAAAYSGLMGLDVNTAKTLYATQQVEPIKIYWRAALLFAPAIPVFIYGALQRGARGMWSFILAVFLVFVAVILGSRFGARYDFLCFATVAAASACWLHEKHVRANKFRIALIASALLACFVSANIAISFYRNSPTASMNDYQSVLADGQVILSGIGLPHLPDSAAYATGVLDDYIFSNMTRLEIYLENYRDEPGWGQVMFYIPAQQLGWNEGSEIKRAVDAMYEVIGIKVNIWATGVRDLHMDYGSVGSIGFALFCGCLFALCKLFSSNSFFAGVCGVLLLGFALFLPFGLIWKSPFLQMGILICLGALAIDLLTSGALTRSLTKSGSCD